MKYVIHPLALASIAVVLAAIGLLLVAIFTPSVIWDFLKSITPDTEAELRTMYLILTAAGAVILVLILRHKKPYKFKRKKSRS